MNSCRNDAKVLVGSSSSDNDSNFEVPRLRWTRVALRYTFGRTNFGGKQSLHKVENRKALTVEKKGSDIFWTWNLNLKVYSTLKMWTWMWTPKYLPQVHFLCASSFFSCKFTFSVQVHFLRASSVFGEFSLRQVQFFSIWLQPPACDIARHVYLRLHGWHIIGVYKARSNPSKFSVPVPFFDLHLPILPLLLPALYLQKKSWQGCVISILRKWDIEVLEGKP